MQKHRIARESSRTLEGLRAAFGVSFPCSAAECLGSSALLPLTTLHVCNTEFDLHVYIN